MIWGEGGLLVTQMKKIFDLLDEYYPEAAIALNFKGPLQLLVAVILAAQCTDDRVNKVTRELFRKYRSAEDYALAPLHELEEDVRTTGFYRNKAKSIKGACTMIVDEFGGRVPDNLNDLLRLPGVGRKSANIILNECFSIPAIGVDTHVFRVSRRLGFSDKNGPDKVEADLRAQIPQEKWHRVTRVLTAHGKALCTARKPLCDRCPVENLCAWRKADPRQGR
jgi:endonuclease-3